MVYCGKPSKSCAECRLRRTKCDMKKPSCSQCIRARRVCKGYRDPNDLMFRDESRGLIAKAQRQSPPKKTTTTTNIKSTRIANTDTRETNTSQPVGFQFAPIISVPAGLETPAEEQATTFFFQNYVPDRMSFPTGTFQYLEDIFSRETVGQAVKDAITALGIAGLSNFWKSPNILLKARIKYTSSMKLLSSQLTDANEAKSNQTFAAVMLLGLYEITNMCHKKESMDVWTRHTLGSSALMRFRGKKQLREPLGRELFLHHRSQVLANCMQRHAFIPPFIREWNDSLDMENPSEHHSTILSQQYIKFADLRAELTDSNEFSNPETTISRASAIDAECVKWEHTIPVEFFYRTLRVQGQTEEVFEGKYDVYSNLWIAMIWNNQRSLRIRCQDLILNQLKRFYRTHLTEVLFNDHTYYQRRTLQSEQIILKCSADILSSIPGFLGFKDEPHAERKIPRSFNGNLLLWPLFNAGYNDVISNERRDWVVGRLRYISDVMGIEQAQPLINILVSKMRIQHWAGPPTSNLLGTALLGNVNSSLLTTHKSPNNKITEIWNGVLSSPPKENSLVSLTSNFESPQRDVSNISIAQTSGLHSNITPLQDQNHTYESLNYQPNSLFLGHIYEEATPDYTTYSSGNFSPTMLQNPTCPNPTPISNAFHSVPYQTYATSMPLGDTRGLDAMSGCFEGEW